jgi:magnesium chelatase family protein
VPTPNDRSDDFVDVIGQTMAKRALEVAAAGAHNVLLIGAPGGGKTMMARRMPGILPPLNFDDALECTSIHSVAGTLPVGTALIAERPFRAPHHTTSEPAMIGNGRLPRPGEISLAHNGVLFLDELAEFDRSVLEALRQPLEEGCITVSRAARTTSFPSRFMLMAAMNPCPCGFRGDQRRLCRCSDPQIQRYVGKISGPLLDRIDLVVEVPAAAARSNAPICEERSIVIRGRVADARARQRSRFLGASGVLNSQLLGSALREHCALDRYGSKLLDAAIRKFFLSARGTDRLLRVSRTIADLAAAPSIRGEHLAEALQYRVIFA